MNAQGMSQIESLLLVNFSEPDLEQDELVEA
jgi:hypothetical protein